MPLNREQKEELVQAIHEGDVQGARYEGVAKRFLESSWAALCHKTGRAARFYQPDDQSPEARIYRLMSQAFSE